MTVQSGIYTIGTYPDMNDSCPVPALDGLLQDVRNGSGNDTCVDGRAIPEGMPTLEATHAVKIAAAGLDWVLKTRD